MERNTIESMVKDYNEAFTQAMHWISEMQRQTKSEDMDRMAKRAKPFYDKAMEMQEKAKSSGYEFICEYIINNEYLFKAAAVH